MSNLNTFPRNKTSEWTPHDFLALGAAIALLIAVTGALSTREQWSPLVGANANVPTVIATFNTTDYHAMAFDPREERALQRVAGREKLASAPAD